MNKIGGKIVLWALIVAMLIFTAIRTLHFLQMTFPVEQQYVAYLGLAAFDIGVLGWLYYSTKSAEGAAQRAIAYGMVFVCLLGVICTTIADMVLVSAQRGLTALPNQWGTVGLWAVILVIVLNVTSGVLVHLVDPGHQKHLAQEGARDKIHSAVTVHILKQADMIAPQIAAAVARHWSEQTIAEMTGMLPGGQQVPRIVNSTAQQVSLPQTATIPETGDLPATPVPDTTKHHSIASIIKGSLGVLAPYPDVQTVKNGENGGTEKKAKK